MKRRLIYLSLFIATTLLVVLAPLPDKAAAFGDQWIAYTYGTWGFPNHTRHYKWQEVIYQSQQRVTTGYLNWFGNNGIRLYNSGTGRGFPLVFNSECTPDSGATCNRDGDYIGHNGNTGNPSPLPARDYYNNHDESWSWYRNADWAVDFRFRGNCTSGNCSGLGNNFLYAQTRENRTGFAVGANLHELRWYYTHDNSTSYLGSINASAHTGRVERVWATWSFWIDGGNRRNYGARQTSPDSRGDRIMTNLNIGNLQQVNARWPEVSLDYVNISYALPDGLIDSILTSTGGAPVSSGPPVTFAADTSIRVNTWTGDKRGVGTVNYYINSNTSGNSSGSWWNFGSVNGGGSRSLTTNRIMTCPAGYCASGVTRLVAVNTYDVYGNLRQQWNLETRQQQQVRWLAPPTPTPIPTATPVPNLFRFQMRCADGSIPNLTGVGYYLNSDGGGGNYAGTSGSPDSNWFSYRPTGTLAWFGPAQGSGGQWDPVAYNLPAGFYTAVSGSQVRILPANVVPGQSYELYFRTTYGCATPTPTATHTPAPTSTPTPTPTATPWVNVLIENPGGAAVSRYTCAAGGDGGSVQETGLCDTNSNVNFAVENLTDRTNMGAYIDLIGLVLIGVRNTTAGGILDQWSNFTPNYSWPRWYTGSRTVTFIVASPTPTPTSTPPAPPTPTPSFHQALVTPVAYVDTTNTGMDPGARPTPSGGGPNPATIPNGLVLTDFYYPLQVWLKMIPTVGVGSPASWCVAGTCYEANSRPISYTYIGMSRNGDLTATTPYTESFNLAAPYAFTSTNKLNLFWEFPNIDDHLGLNPPTYYYTSQKPGRVDFHYQVQLRHTWTAAQTATWPVVSSPMPPCVGWGGPGTVCEYEETITINPAAAPMQMRMWLYRPTMEETQEGGEH